MDLTQLANLGEFIGGVAVLVRNGAREQRTSSMQETIREIATVFLSTGANDENTVLWLKGLADFEAMEITERVRFRSMAGSLMDLTVFTDKELSEMVRIQTEAEMRLLEAGE